MGAARYVVRSLERVLEHDWDVPAGELSWSCRTTVDHMADSLLWYAAHLSMRAERRMPHPRRGDLGNGPAETLEVIRAGASILADVARCAPASARAFHPAGRADRSGFLGMACDELLVHGHDVALGLGVPFEPPVRLTQAVLHRLFPWAPSGHDPWRTLLWANGRISLPDHERLDDDWFWHCAPLDEWDGRMNRRSTSELGHQLPSESAPSPPEPPSRRKDGT